MLRTTSKQALVNIRSYIVNNSNFENWGIETPKDFKACAKFIMHCFCVEFLPTHRVTNYQEMFIDWLSGLPSCLDTCYYYNRSAIDDLGAILEETEEEKAKYTEHEASRMLSALIWREIYKACDYEIK